MPWSPWIASNKLAKIAKDGKGPAGDHQNGRTIGPQSHKKVARIKEAVSFLKEEDFPVTRASYFGVKWLNEFEFA